MAANQKIRIRLKAYDHEVIDQSAKKIIPPAHAGGSDAKYTFNFDKMVKDVKAMHEHYKLDGSFTGEPKFKYHDEFQANAKEKTGDKKGKGK